MGDTTKLSQVNLILNGRVVSDPVLVVKYGGTKILRVLIENKRRSGRVDTFNVHFPNSLGVVLKSGMFIELTGDIRSVNERSNDQVVYPYVMASTIRILDDEPSEYKNDVEIIDAELVEFDRVRKGYTVETKLLATYRIRINRKHGRYSFFRVTTWGKDAVYMGNVHKSVKRLHLRGRLQSYESKVGKNLCFGYVTYFLEAKPEEK